GEGVQLQNDQIHSKDVPCSSSSDGEEEKPVETVAFSELFDPEDLLSYRGDHEKSEGAKAADTSPSSSSSPSSASSFQGRRSLVKHSSTIGGMKAFSKILIDSEEEAPRERFESKKTTRKGPKGVFGNEGGRYRAPPLKLPREPREDLHPE